MSEYIKDRNAEMCVLGTLFVNNEFLLKSDVLQPKHFYYKELATLYYAMIKLKEKKILTFDDLSILNIVESNKQMKDHMSNAGVKDLIEFIEDLKILARNDFNEYNSLMKRIMTLSFKRKSKDKLQSLINECDNDNNDDLNKFNYNMQNEISSIASEYLFDDETPLLSKTIRGVWDKIVSQRSGDGVIGIPSKYESVNSYYTYRKKGLVVVGGRAKAGKSIFLSNEAYHKLKHGVKVAIFDTELPTEDWLPRFLAEITGLTINQIESGKYNKEEAEKIDNALKWIEEGSLVHKYDPEWNMDKIYTRAKQIKLKYGLDMLIYDYIKADDVELNGMAEHTYLGKLTSFLKNKIAGELDLAVIAAAQMNDNELRLADSRKIQRYASTIVYWMEKDTDKLVQDGNEEGTHYLYIDFNRHGGKNKSNNKGEAVTYINFVMDGDKAIINMAKVHYHESDNMPY